MSRPSRRTKAKTRNRTKASRTVRRLRSRKRPRRSRRPSRSQSRRRRRSRKRLRGGEGGPVVNQPSIVKQPDYIRAYMTDQLAQHRARIGGGVYPMIDLALPNPFGDDYLSHIAYKVCMEMSKLNRAVETELNSIVYDDRGVSWIGELTGLQGRTGEESDNTVVYSGQITLPQVDQAEPLTTDLYVIGSRSTDFSLSKAGVADIREDIALAATRLPYLKDILSKEGDHDRFRRLREVFMSGITGEGSGAAEKDWDPRGGAALVKHNMHRAVSHEHEWLGYEKIAARAESAGGNAPIFIVTGHSLGGAIVMSAAEELPGLIAIAFNPPVKDAEGTKGRNTIVHLTEGDPVLTASLIPMESDTLSGYAGSCGEGPIVHGYNNAPNNPHYLVNFQGSAHAGAAEAHDAGAAQAQAATAEPTWISDDVNFCMMSDCTRQGAVLGRFTKHHCRMCGIVVCDSCSRNKLHLNSWFSDTSGHPVKHDGRTKKKRVCDACFDHHSEHPGDRNVRLPDRSRINEAGLNVLIT